MKGYCDTCQLYDCYIEKIHETQDGHAWTECTDCYMQDYYDQLADNTYSTRSSSYLKRLLTQLLAEIHK